VSRDGVYAIFYPLYNPTCPCALSVEGEVVVGRMMRRKGVQICRHLVRSDAPTILMCRECKLGVVANREYAVQVRCVHGDWTRTRGGTASTRAAQRLGAPLMSCDICGITCPLATDWTWNPGGRASTFLDTLFFCGPTCRARAQKMPLLR